MTLSTRDIVALAKAGVSEAAIAKLAGEAKPRGNGKSRSAKTAKPSKEEFETALIAACKAKGYANPEPRFNILTYGKWVEKGRRVRKGEKSLRVNGQKTMLFHEAQTDAIAVEPPKAVN